MVSETEVCEVNERRRTNEWLCPCRGGHGGISLRRMGVLRGVTTARVRQFHFPLPFFDRDTSLFILLSWAIVNDRICSDIISVLRYVLFLLLKVDSEVFPNINNYPSYRLASNGSQPRYACSNCAFAVINTDSTSSIFSDWLILIACILPLK